METEFRYIALNQILIIQRMVRGFASLPGFGEKSYKARSHGLVAKSRGRKFEPQHQILDRCYVDCFTQHNFHFYPWMMGYEQLMGLKKLYVY